MSINLKLPKTTLDAGIVILIIKVICGSSQVVIYTDLMDTILTVVASLLLISHILIQKYDFKTIIGYAFMGLLALYSSYQSGYSILLITVLVCFAIREIELDDVIQFIFSYEVLFFILHSIYVLVYFVINNEGLFAGGGLALGFTHKNNFSEFIFNLIIMWCWINFESLTGAKVRNVFLGGLVVFALTSSRTFIFEIIILCILLFLGMYGSNFVKRCYKHIASVIVPILSIVTIGLSNAYLNGIGFAKLVDTLLSSRIKLGAYALDKWGFTMLGQRVSTIISWEAKWGLNKHTFDNIYTFAAFNLGIFWIVLISILFFALARKNNYKVNLFLILWAVYGVTEVHGLNGLLCFPILLVVDLLNRKFETNDNGEVKSMYDLGGI